jgi:hypothetical protein
MGSAIFEAVCKLNCRFEMSNSRGKSRAMKGEFPCLPPPINCLVRQTCLRAVPGDDLRLACCNRGKLALQGGGDAGMELPPLAS